MYLWKKYLDVHADRFLEELKNLLRIPSVSAQAEHKVDMLRCASAFKKALRCAGADHAVVFPTEGHPIVYGEKVAGADKPTVLVYGHYDVQPAGPTEGWHSDPFEPIVREGRLYGRGSSDDKGQVFMHIKALETMVRTGGFSCNVKFLIEGEEEIGSTNLFSFVQKHRDLLECDVILVSDSSMQGLDRPSIDVGLRGLVYLEIEMTGPNRDLHSGVYGGAVANPATLLARLLASLHDEHHRVTVPGFYMDVTDLTDIERSKLESAPFDENVYKNSLGVDALWGEDGYSVRERTGIRPTLEINGIWGGYMGVGAKTVLPSKAFAKISCRLVPNQRGGRIANLVKDHLMAIVPPGVEMEVRILHHSDPFLTPVDSTAFRAAEWAFELTLGEPTIPVRGGFSIPIIRYLQEQLRANVILLGFGLDSDNLHGPDEKLELANFYKGIETIPWFLRYFATMHLMGE